MDKYIWIIIWVLIALLSMIALTLLYWKFVQSKKKRRLKVVENLSKRSNNETLSKIESILTRVDLIAQNNIKYKITLDKLTIKFDEIDLEIKAINSLLQNLALSYKKMSSSEFDSHVKKMNESINKVEKLSIEFENDADSIIQQDSFVRSELTFYQKHLRDIIAIYKNKRVFLKEIAPNVDALITSIKDNEDKLNNALDLGDNKLMKDEMANYSKKVISLANIIDEGPAVQTFLFKTIPEKTMQLLEEYKLKKIELKTNFKNLNFSGSLNEIRSKFHTAKQLFERLDVEKTKDKIKDILKSLKLLEEMINVEIYSRNLFLENFEQALNEIKSSLNSFVSIKKRIKKMNKELITPELKEVYETTKVALDVLDKDAIEFSETIKDKDISFSAKLSRMKRVVKENIIFIKHLNELEEVMWNLNSRSLLFENKFLRTTEALNSLVANMKKNRVSLTKDEKIVLQNLRGEIEDMAVTLKIEKLSKEDEKRIEELMAKVSEFYIVISGNIQMALLAQDLIKKLSAKRSSDPNLEFTLSTAEKEYLSGRYDAALNAIIVWMEVNS